MNAFFHNARRLYINVATQERCRIGASLFRIVAGLTILYQYLLAYHQRLFLFGPNGVVPFDWFIEQLHQTGSFSLYALDRSTIAFDAIFHGGILIAVLWIVGWHTRLMTLLTWICVWSLHQRNPTLWDGGDNLVQIVLIYAVFANLGATYSMDAAKRRPRWLEEGAARQAVIVLHNAAMFAVTVQLCLVYGIAGLYKIQGTLWQNGTALYYILRVGEFSWPGYGAAIYE
ncbi:MAG TPA: hypothetical protein VFX76_18385, partial [Roseiflexaceae bacterium]|nr:hypothetical protein [Roseiflexaceae bacterium]